MSSKTTLEVGDRIKISTWMSSMTVEIDRVTKTKAVSKPYNDAGAVYEFKRGVNSFGPRPYTPRRWDTTIYELV